MKKDQNSSHSLKGRLKSLFNLRSSAGITFLAGDLTLAFGGAVNESWAHTTAGVLLVIAAMCVTLSSRNPRWLYAAGSNVVASQALIAWAADGAGQGMQRLGTIAPVLNGLLLLRGARQAIHGKGQQFKSKNVLSKPLEVIDRYPIFAGSSIEIPGAIFISIGAAMSQSWPLAGAAVLWVLGLGLMAASDPNAKRATTKIRYHAKKFLMS